MVCRLSHLLNRRRNGFALIPALAAVAALAAPAASASAATPLTGETLTGTATTTSGSLAENVSCIDHIGEVGASATFTASGTASGPYPGGFVDTEGSAGLSGFKDPPWTLRLNIPFTITSETTTGTTTETTTITGKITNAYPSIGVGGFICNGSSFAGFDVDTLEGVGALDGASYTATITAPGQAAQTVTGHVAVNGSLSIQPNGPGKVTYSFFG
jgi:hypothetical protein